MKTKAIKVLIVMTVMATLLSACGSSKETDVAPNQGEATIENEEKVSSANMISEADGT